MNKKYTKNCTSCLEQFETNEKKKTTCDYCESGKDEPRKRTKNSFLRMSLHK